MPYTVVTKDGIRIQNIPDDVKPDDPSVKAKVEAARAKRDGVAAPQAEGPGFAERAATSTGQMARAALTGLGGIPAFVADIPFNALSSIGVPVEPGFASKQFQRGLSAVGLPEPGGTTPETLASALTGGAGAPKAAALALEGLAPTTQAAAQLVSRNVLAKLAAGPGAQAAGGVGGAAAQEAARAAGAPAPIQFLANLAGGALTPTAGRGAANLAASLDPLTEAGRRQIVGDSLRQFATNPEKAVVNLANSREIIPGSRPTSAAAARDAGLAAIETPVLEQTIGGAAARTTRLDANNAARQKYLNDRGITSERAQDIVSQAGEAIDPMIAKAFEGASRPRLGKVANLLGGIKKSDDYVKGAVVKAVSEVEAVLQRAGGEGGRDLTVGRLWKAKQEIQMLRLGKYSGDKGDLKLAASQLKQVEQAIDNAIEAAAPGYKNARDVYAKMAKVGDSVDTAANIRAKGTSTQMDSQGEYELLSLGKMRQALRSAEANPKATLLPVHKQRIERVLEDLDRASMPTSANVRSPGSPTARNLTMAYVLGKVLSGRTAENSTARAVSKVFEPIYGFAKTDEQVQALLVEAMMNPKVAQQLLSEANLRNAQQLANSLQAIAARGAVGGTAGTLATQQ